VVVGHETLGKKVLRPQKKLVPGFPLLMLNEHDILLCFYNANLLCGEDIESMAFTS